MSAPSNFKPLYTTYQSVKVRLTNKVQFQSGAAPEDGELPDELLGQLIVDAETEVEQDLRSRYAIPFRSVLRKTFLGLPDHSQRAIRIVCDLKAVSKILKTDFGSGGHVNADNYTKVLDDEYEEAIKRLLGRDREAESSPHDRFRFSPPLEDLALAATNIADDGFKGMIINTDSDPFNSTGYAIEQVNDPALSYNSGLRRRGWWRGPR